MMWCGGAECGTTIPVRGAKLVKRCGHQLMKKEVDLQGPAFFNQSEVFTVKNVKKTMIGWKKLGPPKKPLVFLDMQTGYIIRWLNFRPILDNFKF